LYVGNPWSYVIFLPAIWGRTVIRYRNIHDTPSPCTNYVIQYESRSSVGVRGGVAVFNGSCEAN
jgi:hypothetical protein